jgi:hypothetical protein
LNTAERRLERLTAALTARERAILFLQAYKAGETTDPYDEVRSGIDREYERLMDIVRFVNGELADCVLIIREQVTQAELRLAWMEQAHRHAGDLALVREYLDACVPVPITKRQLTRHRGKRPAQGFDVRRDDDADEVALLLKNRAAIDVLLRGGVRIELPLDLTTALPDEPETLLDMLRAVAASLRDGLQSYWSQLAAIETVAAEYGQEFDGEDPLKPACREYVDDAKASIESARQGLLRFIGPWELSDDEGRSLAATRALAVRVLG